MKTFFTVMTLCTVFSAFAAVDCQMLLPEKEQKEILSLRRYPQSTKRRLWAAAIKEGFAALDKKDLDNAMREFNRAWRFNPENMDAYWGAAIVPRLNVLMLLDVRVENLSLWEKPRTLWTLFPLKSPLSFIITVLLFRLVRLL